MIANNAPSRVLFGHPTGLFTLFFAEMWERFSYYGMRALLVFYMTKGFLKYQDSEAYAVYGAYTALVYMAPFFGGILADRLLGARRAVILGGLLMAAGQLLLMTAGQLPLTAAATLTFFTALALLDLRQRLLQAQHLHDRRHALRARQPQARRRIHDLLHGGQPGRRHVAAVVRLHRRDLRLGPGLRPGHDRNAHRGGRVRGAARVSPRSRSAA